jgi:hypothetical protein
MSTAAIRTTTDSLTVDVSPTTIDYCVTIAFAIGAAAFFAFGSAKLFGSLSTDFNSRDVLIDGLQLALLTVWGIAICVMLPQALRRSTLTISGDVLSIEGILPLLRLHRYKSFELCNVSNIRLVHLSLRASPPVVAFDYGSKTHFFGRGCKEQDIVQMVSVIGNRIQTHRPSHAATNPV